MCYPLPGPRCYNHALKSYTQAIRSGNLELIASTKQDLEQTPTVITQLRQSGHFGRAERAEQDRALRMSLLREQRERTPLFGELRKMKQASDPFTDTEELDVLADHESPFVQMGVAGNPNTSSVTLDRMAWGSGEEESAPDMAVMREILANHNTSSGTLGRFCLLAKEKDSDGVEHYVAMKNPSFDTQAIHVALDHHADNPEALLALASHANVDTAALDRIYHLLRRNEPLYGSFEGDELTGPARANLEFQRAATYNSLASNPLLSEETRQGVLDGTLPQRDINAITVGLAANPQLTASEFHRLSTMSRGSGVNMRLLKNPHTPQYLLQQIYDGGLPSLRERVAAAASPRTPRALLAELGARGPHGEINACHEALASNPIWTPDELRAMAQPSLTSSGQHRSVHPDIATGLLRNPNTPDDVVEMLANSDNALTVEAVMRSPRLTDSIATRMLSVNKDWSIKNDMTGNSATTKKNERRLAFAANPVTSGAILTEVAQLTYDNPHSQIDPLIARHPNTPRPVLKQYLRTVMERPDTKLTGSSRSFQKVYREDMRESLLANPSVPAYWKLAIRKMEAQQESRAA